MSTQPTAHPVLGLSDDARQRMHSKLQILHLLDHYRLAHDYSHHVAQVMFTRAWNTGELAMDDALRSDWPQLSAKTLDKWRLKLKAKGITALAGEYGKRKGQSCIDQQPEIKAAALGMLVQFPHANATRVMEFLQARFRDAEAVTLPAERTLSRWLTAWKTQNAQTYTAITNPDAWKNKFMSAQGSASEGITELNQLWEVDCTPADLQLVGGRYVLSCGIDVYSRRMRMLVTKSARSAANAQLLRTMMLEFGVPARVKTDNGADYTSVRYELVLDNLKIEHRRSREFSPWQKPHIERGQKTFLHDLLELLPGYSGHNVADAQALRASKSFADRLFEKNKVVELKLTPEQLQQFCDDWCTARYEHRVHSELGATPFQQAAAYRGAITRIENVRVLDLLLAEIPDNKGLRTVQKKGIRLPDGWYIAPELEAHIGRMVRVFYTDDAGKVVAYAHEDSQFVCVAELPELTGISRQEIAAKADAMQKERIQAARAAMREISKRVNAKDAAAEILRDNLITSGKLVQFPRRAESLRTDALQAAAQALDALNPQPRDRYELISEEEFTRMRVEAEAKELVPTPRFESRRDRAWWLAAEAYKRDLTSEETEYLSLYRRDCPRDAKDMDQLMLERYGDDAVEL